MSPRARNGKAEPVKKRGIPRARRPKDEKPEGQPTPPPPPDGEPKRRMSVIEKIQLVDRVHAARMKPKPDTWQAISKREGVPTRTCQFIYAQFQTADGKLADTTGTRVLRETLHIYEGSIETLADLAANGETGAVRVGAVRQLLDAAKGRVELLAVMGRMPRSFRAIDELVLLQRLTRRFAEIVEQHDLPPEVIAEFLALADEIDPVIDGTAVRELPRAS